MERTTFIVEDEALAVKKLTRLIEEVAPEFEILGHAGSITGAVEWLADNPAPDLIFMDIELSDGQSFEIFQQADVTCPVIFVTSYDEFALQAFKVNSVDYLLKPVQREDLAKALAKFGQMYKQPPAREFNLQRLLETLGGQADMHREFRTRFLVKHMQRFISVPVTDIAYFWSEGRVNFMRTHSGQKYIVDYKMEDLETMLDPRDWFRVSRQFIVSIPSVQQIHPYFNNRLKLYLKPESAEEVTVSRERVNDFKVWMGK